MGPDVAEMKRRVVGHAHGIFNKMYGEPVPSTWRSSWMPPIKSTADMDDKMPDVIRAIGAGGSGEEECLRADEDEEPSEAERLSAEAGNDPRTWGTEFWGPGATPTSMRVRWHLLNGTRPKKNETAKVRKMNTLPTFVSSVFRLGVLKISAEERERDERRGFTIRGANLLYGRHRELSPSELAALLLILDPNLLRIPEKLIYEGKGPGEILGRVLANKIKSSLDGVPPLRPFGRNVAVHGPVPRGASFPLPNALVFERPRKRKKEEILKIPWPCRKS